MSADVLPNASTKRASPPIAWSASAWIRTSIRLPADLRDDPQPLFAFNRRIVDATCDSAAAYKPQIAFYSALGREAELVASIRYIRERAPAALVILDAKRNDIGNTAEAYAREAFERYGADAVTVNPYMGEDSVRPFLAPTRPRRRFCCAAPRIPAPGISRICWSTVSRSTDGSPSAPPPIGMSIGI